MLATRALLGPAILLAALAHWPGKLLGFVVLLALLSDIFDGILARRWSTDTPNLRLSDSLADTVFYLGTAAALWVREPQLLRHNASLLATLAALELTRYLLDLTKFGKSAGYHSWLSKLWGLVLAFSLVAVFSFRTLRPLIPVSIALGIASNLEGLAISLVLPRWQTDVKHLGAAWRLRRHIQGSNLIKPL